MKNAPANTINDDTEYAEACRVQNELAAKKQTVDDALNRELLWARDHEGAANDDKLISDAVALKPGVAAEIKGARVEQISTLQTQSFQLGQAMARQAEKVLLTARAAGYRVFAKDSAGYITHAEQLLELVDSVIAANQTLEADSKALFQRGCAELPQIRFPTPDTADHLQAWRRDIARQIDVLRLIAQGNR